MPHFLSCFPGQTSLDEEQQTRPLTSTGSDGEGGGCTFCNVSREKGFNVVFEDDNLLAFHDRNPRARVHLLIIPRAHVVDSVRGLTREHLPLLRSMTDLAATLVPSPVKMGFHIPPFSSVPHLHLHVFSGPHTLIGRLKYPISHGRGPGREHGHAHARDEDAQGQRKRWGWFVTPSQVEGILNSGGRVGLGRG